MKLLILIGISGMQAIEVALSIPALLLPPDQAVFFTTRTDLGSFCTAAILKIRQKLHEASIPDVDTAFNTKQTKRINLVAETGKFSQAGEWKPYPLPTYEEPWHLESASASDRRELAAINAAILDFKVAPQTRLQWMIDWILTGKEPAYYREYVEAARFDLIKAIENHEIKLCGLTLLTKDGIITRKLSPIGAVQRRVVEKFHIAVVESRHRSATMIGYNLAPVKVVYNPKRNKFTICQFREGYVNLEELKTRLNVLEKEKGTNATWCGSNTIMESSQVGDGTRLGMDEVLAEIIKLYQNFNLAAT